MDDDFSIHSQKIKDYSSDNKGEVEIVQDLQKIIDEFKEWAAMVTKGIDLFEEMRYLELQADAYGGVRNSFVPEQIHLLGNEFRVGISARVNKKRSHLKWSVYYYIRHEGKWEVLGQVQLNSNQFNPSNEGLWLIEAPEQSTFYKVTKKDIKKYFSKDRQWSKIIPVMAFGDWTSDPMREVGKQALEFPNQYPEFFEEDRVAFLGKRTEVGFIRGKISLRVPRYVYRNDKPEAQMFVRIPKYAQEWGTKAVEVTVASKLGGPDPKVDPKKHRPVAVASTKPPEHPSISKIEFEKNSKEGNYTITVVATLQGIDKEFQPLDTSTFLYIDQDNPASEDTTTAQTDSLGLTPYQEKMTALVGRSAAILGEATNLHNSIKSKALGLSSKINQVESNAKSLIQQLQSDLRGQSINPVTEIKNIEKDMYSSAFKLARIRSSIEGRAYAVCSAYEQSRPKQQSEKIRTFKQESEHDQREVTRHYEDYLEIKQKMDKAKKRSKDLRRKLMGRVGNYKTQLIKFDALKDSVRDLSGDFKAVESLISQLEGIGAKIQGVINEAASIIAEVSKISKEGLSQENKNIIKSINELYGTVVAKKRDNRFV